MSNFIVVENDDGTSEFINLDATARFSVESSTGTVTIRFIGGQEHCLKGDAAKQFTDAVNEEPPEDGDT